jgi:hypothetical protein
MASFFVVKITKFALDFNILGHKRQLFYASLKIYYSIVTGISKEITGAFKILFIRLEKYTNYYYYLCSVLYGII